MLFTRIEELLGRDVRLAAAQPSGLVESSQSGSARRSLKLVEGTALFDGVGWTALVVAVSSLAVALQML